MRKGARGNARGTRGDRIDPDGGVEGRKIFHKLRSQAIEPFNGLCKNVFERRVKRPVQGVQRSQWLALGAVALHETITFASSYS